MLTIWYLHLLHFTSYIIDLCGLPTVTCVRICDRLGYFVHGWVILYISLFRQIQAENRNIKIERMTHIHTQLDIDKLKRAVIK